MEVQRKLASLDVILWLRENYKVGKNGSVSKNSVYQHYYDSCQDKGIDPVISATYFGKLVKRAFPGIKYNRKGPRGSAVQHYTCLKRAKHVVDGSMVAACSTGTSPYHDYGGTVGGGGAPFTAEELALCQYSLKRERVDHADCLVSSPSLDHPPPSFSPRRRQAMFPRIFPSAASAYPYPYSPPSYSHHSSHWSAPDLPSTSHHHPPSAHSRMSSASPWSRSNTMDSDTYTHDSGGAPYSSPEQPLTSPWPLDGGRFPPSAQGSRAISPSYHHPHSHSHSHPHNHPFAPPSRAHYDPEDYNHDYYHHRHHQHQPPQHAPAFHPHPSDHRHTTSLLPYDPHHPNFPSSSSTTSVPRSFHSSPPLTEDQPSHLHRPHAHQQRNTTLLLPSPRLPIPPAPTSRPGRLTQPAPPRACTAHAGNSTPTSPASESSHIGSSNPPSPPSPRPHLLLPSLDATAFASQLPPPTTAPPRSNGSESIDPPSAENAHAYSRHSTTTDNNNNNGLAQELVNDRQRQPPLLLPESSADSLAAPMAPDTFKPPTEDAYLIPFASAIDTERQRSQHMRLQLSRSSSPALEHLLRGIASRDVEDEELVSFYDHYLKS